MASWSGRVLIALLSCIVAFLCSVIRALGTDHDLVAAVLTFPVVLMVAVFMAASAAVLNHVMAPDATRLAGSQDGRALLSEGQRLRDHRTKMTEGSDGPHPLLEAFYAPTHVFEPSDQVIRRKQEVNERFWNHQIALERTLRDRQERYLRGERVDIIGHLSDRTP